MNYLLEDYLPEDYSPEDYSPKGLSLDEVLAEFGILEECRELARNRIKEQKHSGITKRLGKWTDRDGQKWKYSMRKWIKI